MERTDNSPSGHSGSPHQWDFECGFVSDPLCQSRHGRIRASSWDDSDDNLPPIPDNSGSKTCRIYSSDDNKFRPSVSSEINELKKEFFENLEKEKERQESPVLETNCDRRLSPARIRRRSKSSGSSSSMAETDGQMSPTKINRLTELETDFQDANPVSLEYDPKSYLANFFTELRSRRISLLDSMSTLEKLAQEVSNYDEDSIPLYDESFISDGKDSDGYFCKTSRKLSQILEVEENRKDMEKSSEENISNSSLFQKCFTKPESDFSPLQTSRSKKSEEIPENQEETQQRKEKFRSLSSEYLTNFQKPQKLTQGSVTDRSARFFDQKLDDDFISLSAKTAKTQLAAQNEKAQRNVSFNENQANKSTFSPRKSKQADKYRLEDQKDEKDFDLLKTDLKKSTRFEDSALRKNTDRFERTNNPIRTKSGKSRKSWNPESPKFTIDIDRDSARSLKTEDANRLEEKPREEEFSFGKSSSCISENSSEAKTEIISQKSLQSASEESEISTRRSIQEPESTTNRSKGHNSTQRSHGKRRKPRTDNIIVESETKEPNSPRLVDSDAKSSNSVHLLERTPQQSPTVSSRNSGKPPKTCRSKCSGRSGSDITPNNCEIVQTPNSKSRTSKSPKTTEDTLPDQLSNQGTPRSKKILELGLPLDVSERPESQKESHRSSTQTELPDVTRDGYRTDSKHRNRRRSEQSSSSRTKNTESSPRNLKVTPRTNTGSSKRSKDSLENRNGPGNLENFRLTSWKEFGKVCDSNHSSISPASGGEMKIPSRQHYYGSEIYNPELDNSVPMASFDANDIKDRLSGSRNSSKTSLDSNITECLDNNSPERSAKTRSRPQSCTSKEYTSSIPSEVERLDINPISERTDRSSIIEEAEDSEENRSTQRSKIGDESDGPSNKRLSVINEISFEDLETSNVSTENEEKDTWDQPKSYSARNTNRISLQTPESSRIVKQVSPKASDWSLHENSSIDLGKGQEWTELISKFQKKSDVCILDRNFPGFESQHEISWNSKGFTLEENNSAECDETSNLGSHGRKMLQQKLFDKPVTGEKKLDSFNLAYQNTLFDKTAKDFTPPLEIHQNIHYVSLDKTGPFGIGEFGDVTCWNPGDSDIKDNEKPKDHGDGIPMLRTAEILPRKSEKTEQEVKNYTDSSPLLNPLFLETENLTHIPCCPKASKSEQNCALGRANKEGDYNIRTGLSFLGDCKHKPETFEENGRINSEVKSSRNITDQHSSSDSLELGRDLEFEYQTTPRLSRSLSNLDIRLQESMHQREPSETLSISGTELFKKTADARKVDKESANFKIFLENKNKGEKISNNWLKLKPSKRTKRRLKKKGSVSPSEPFHNYLTSRKTRPAVPTLKLRHPNCFQNFYKRFISVFCLTSNSSAATSK